jgi:hypothetical protein
VAPQDGDEHVTSVLYPPVSGFWTWDVARNVVYGDANLGDYFGLTRNEFVHGAPLENFVARIDEKDRARVSASIQHAIANRDTFREKYTLHSASRGQRTISAVGRCYFDDNGEPALFPGWFVDISDTHTSRRTALRTAEHHIDQARTIAQTLDEELLCYMLEMSMVELSEVLDRTDRLRPS